MSIRIATLFLATALVTRAQDALEPLEAAEELEEMVVTADATVKAPASLGMKSLQTVELISREELQRNAHATLGETLGWQPGVSSSYFGPASSRPVIRGFEGVRVRLLRDNLGTFDLSDLSPDHGVALEPFLLDSVEVHRGPASLLYGNSAIGGAVNTRSKALAREHPERAISGGWEAVSETQGNGLAGAGHLSLMSGPVIFRFTGSARDSDDISIPSTARSGAYEILENPRVYDPASGSIVPVPNPDGTLPNSGHEGSSWSAGVTWLPEDARFLLGASYSRFDSRYGVPYFYPGDPTDLYGDYDIDLQLDRFDLEGRMDFDGSFATRLEGHFGYGAYRHAELFGGKGKDQGRDFPDSTFEKDAIEGRIDLHHEAFEGKLSGVMGLSGGTEDFTAVRVVFPPPDAQQVRSAFRSDSIGAYLLEKLELGEWSAQLGHRIEKLRILDQSLDQFGIYRDENDFSQSSSGALTWHREQAGPLDSLSVTGIVSAVERLPTAGERYAFWNNAGIGRFLIGGDLDGTPLSAEKSMGYELGIEAARDPLTMRLNGYHYDFDNFIFLQEVVADTGGFGRAVQYIERAASFTGFEAEVEWKVRDQLTMTLMSDYVRGENKDDREPIPRMPPLRFGGRLEWKSDAFTAGIEVRHATAQDRVKPAPRPELPSGSYTMVNADASWAVPVRSHELTFFLKATNLLNEEARVSTSFRKDVAPLPGRGLLIGVRHEF